MRRKHSRKEKDKIRKSVLKYYSNPLARKKISIMLRKRYSDLSARKKMSQTKKRQYRENPKLLKKMDRAITKWWREHPHIKKQRSEEAKALFMKHPEKFKKFLKYGSNPNVPSFKTKQKFLVRSKGEQTIANFLHDNNITALYEKKVLIFKEEGQICVPDFYLPASKTYIEFYGGHPRAWKKKVMKNKLYKKHKIKCIFITPAELRNLGKELKGEEDY